MNNYYFLKERGGVSFSYMFQPIILTVRRSSDLIPFLWIFQKPLGSGIDETIRPKRMC